MEIWSCKTGICFFMFPRIVTGTDVLTIKHDSGSVAHLMIK